LGWTQETGDDISKDLAINHNDHVSLEDYQNTITQAFKDFETKSQEHSNALLNEKMIFLNAVKDKIKCFDQEFKSESFFHLSVTEDKAKFLAKFIASILQLDWPKVGIKEALNALEDTLANSSAVKCRSTFGKNSLKEKLKKVLELRKTKPMALLCTLEKDEAKKNSLIEKRDSNSEEFPASINIGEGIQYRGYTIKFVVQDEESTDRSSYQVVLSKGDKEVFTYGLKKEPYNLKAKYEGNKSYEELCSPKDFLTESSVPVS
jgi:hypothetical protein